MRVAHGAGWAALVALILLAAGGASTSMSGILLGLPRPETLAVLGAGALGVVALRPSQEIVASWAGLLWLPLALLAGVTLPGVGAFSGPALLAFAFAAGVSALAARPRSWSDKAFFAVVLAVYLVVAARVQLQVGAEGDEPHYLMVAESLLRDHDVDLTHDYTPSRYAAFYRGAVLEPHYRVRGISGQIYSLHSLGLSLLVIPAYAFGGYPAASFFMAFLAALLAREVRRLILDWGGPDWTAWVLALSPPLVHYAGLVFTEVPAALLLALGLRIARRPEGGKGDWLLGAIVGFLPWLHLRYVPLSAILVAYVLSLRPSGRRLLALFAPIAASLVAILAYHQVLYGFPDPRRVWGPRPELALRRIPEGLQGLLLDQEFGLLVYSPLLLLAIPGFASLLTEGRRRDAATVLGLVGAVTLTAAAWPMWRGGFNPPGRFLVPILPVLAGTAALALRGALGARAALLAGWGLWLGLSGGWQPRLVHRDRDGTAPLLRSVSGAVEWTRLLPAYVLSEPDRHRLAWVWSIVLAGAALPMARRGLTARGLCVSSLALVGAAGIAEGLSDGKAGGRESVHLVGRPCLAPPAGPLASSCAGEWRTDVLDWGPAYEPHRYPDGAVVGHCLELSEGRYTLRLEDTGPALQSFPPALEVEAEAGRERNRHEVPLVRTAGGFQGEVQVEPGEVRTTLRLRGGGAFLLGKIRLEAQPQGPAGGPSRR